MGNTSQLVTWGATVEGVEEIFSKVPPILKQVEDWQESGEICHLLQDVLPAYWKKRVEDEEKKRAKKHMAVRIMSLDEQHPDIMECL